MVKETGKLTRNVIGPKIVLVQSNNESSLRLRFACEPRPYSS